MKKFLSFLLPVVAMLCLASCSDDDDLPNVDFNFTFENAVRVDGTIYVAVGDTLDVTSITVVNKEQGERSHYRSQLYLGRLLCRLKCRASLRLRHVYRRVLQSALTPSRLSVRYMPTTKLLLRL